jgi:hypothetical protein
MRQLYFFIFYLLNNKLVPTTIKVKHLFCQNIRTRRCERFKLISVLCCKLFVNVFEKNEKFKLKTKYTLRVV